jgi:glucan phosphoethanolaminetransferase (alkaline phosphatase superfamily)
MSGITFFMALGYWLITALYGALACQTFVLEQFLAPRLFTPLAMFADWHPAIGLALLVAWAAGLQRVRTARGRAAGVAWAASLALIALAAPLATLQTTSAALLAFGVSVGQMIMLSLAELRAPVAAHTGTSRDRSLADLTACCVAAVSVTALHAAVTAWQDGWPAGSILDAAHSVRLHLLLAGATFLLLALVRAAAAMTPRPAAAEAILTVFVLALAFSSFVFSVVLTSLSIRGALAIAISTGIGVSLAGAIGARGSTAVPLADDGVAAVFNPLSPRATANPIGFLLWVAGVAILAGIIATASRAADWNFVLLRSGVILTWLLALAGALSVCRRIPDGGARVSFATAALLLAGHVTLASLQPSLQAASLHNPSAKWLADAIERRPAAAGDQDLVGILHAHTNISRDIHVAPIDVTLAPLAPASARPAPHIFVFVIDSLRRDYLSPYNPAVTFTPAIDALARDSLVYRNAFTQYGATGLSVPSLWVGGQILHKQYVTPFAPMNTLAKLLAHERYDEWISMDNIMDVILPPSVARQPLNQGVAAKDLRLCPTLQEISSRLTTRPETIAPVFAYALPQDVHVSVVTREGAASVDSGDYTGFYAPVASRIRRLDACLGTFVANLKARGLYDGSIIVLTSDHGDSLGEEGRMGHAYSLHPEIVRVPLIVHLPPAMRSAWTWDETAAAFTTDLTPTIYDLLGHEPHAPAPFFGESLARPHGSRGRIGRDRMIAASYGTVYGAVLDGGSRYYVFDAIGMRELAFQLTDAPAAGSPLELTADLQLRGRAVIRQTVEAIGDFYKFHGPAAQSQR